jgi:hypothetical protein
MCAQDCVRELAESDDCEGLVVLSRDFRFEQQALR